MKKNTKTLNLYRIVGVRGVRGNLRVQRSGFGTPCVLHVLQ